jgi:hypothetical protein
MKFYLIKTEIALPYNGDLIKSNNLYCLISFDLFFNFVITDACLRPEYKYLRGLIYNLLIFHFMRKITTFLSPWKLSDSFNKINIIINTKQTHHFIC